MPEYREKWRNITISTEPLDREKTTEALQAAYAAINKKQPCILFFDSPYAANMRWEKLLLEMPEQLSVDVARQVQDKLWNTLVNPTWNEMSSHFVDELEERLWNELAEPITPQLEEELQICHFCIFPDDWASRGSYIDFCISVLNLDCTYKSEWSVLQSIVKNCGIFAPYEKIAFVCERPNLFSFDSQQRLHAEGSPAIQFADGFSLYAQHGVSLPER